MKLPFGYALITIGAKLTVDEARWLDASSLVSEDHFQAVARGIWIAHGSKYEEKGTFQLSGQPLFTHNWDNCWLTMEYSVAEGQAFTVPKGVTEVKIGRIKPENATVAAAAVENTFGAGELFVGNQFIGDIKNVHLGASTDPFFYDMAITGDEYSELKAAINIDSRRPNHSADLQKPMSEFHRVAMKIWQSKKLFPYILGSEFSLCVPSVQDRQEGATPFLQMRPPAPNRTLSAKQKARKMYDAMLLRFFDHGRTKRTSEQTFDRGSAACGCEYCEYDLLVKAMPPTLILCPDDYAALVAEKTCGRDLQFANLADKIWRRSTGAEPPRAWTPNGMWQIDYVVIETVPLTLLQWVPAIPHTQSAPAAKPEPMPRVDLLKCEVQTLLCAIKLEEKDAHLNLRIEGNSCCSGGPKFYRLAEALWYNGRLDTIKQDLTFALQWKGTAPFDSPRNVGYQENKRRPYLTLIRKDELPKK